MLGIFQKTIAQTMFYLFVAISAIGVLLLVNFLLLKYSCNKTETKKDSFEIPREKTASQSRFSVADK
jgi:hypothetical protein